MSDQLAQLAIEGGTPVRAQQLPYGRQSIDDQDIQQVVEVLRSDWLTTGPKIPEFEQAFAKAVGARYAVAVSNGTAALHAAVFAADIGPGDEVITTPMTFAATANSVRLQGGTVLFADVQPHSLNIDPKLVTAQITDRTKAIIPVDFCGQPSDMREIQSLATQHGLVVITDAAHALGATYRDQQVGSLGGLTTFSLHPVKHITTGEGGVVTTDDSALAERVRLFRNHGITTDARQREAQGSWYYEMTELGCNYRISDIQCALGLSQLEKLGGWLERRREIAAQYTEAFSPLAELEAPQVQEDRQSAWHLYVVQLNLDHLRVDRGQIFSALRAENIGVNVHYIPVPWHPYYQSLGYRRGQWPVAEAAYERILSLPIWPGMSDVDVSDTVTAIHKVLDAYRQ